MINKYYIYELLILFDLSGDEIRLLAVGWVYVYMELLTVG